MVNGMTIVVWWKKNMRDSTWKRSRISLKCCLLFNSCFLVTIVARTSLHNFPFGPPHGAVFVLHHGPGAFLHWNLLFFPNVFLFFVDEIMKTLRTTLPSFELNNCIRRNAPHRKNKSQMKAFSDIVECFSFAISPRSGASQFSARVQSFKY